MSFGLDDIDLDALRRRRSEKWRTFPGDVLPAFVAEMDYPLAEPVKEVLHRLVDADDCGYAHADGVAEAFAEFAQRRHRWSVEPGRVFLVGDVMAGVEQVLMLLTRPGDGVVINSPVYPPFFSRVAGQERRVVDVPLTADSALDMPAMERAFVDGARAYLLCNPHNPTGRVWTADELRTVAGLCERHGVLVIADEVHAPLTLRGAVYTPFATIAGDALSRVVTVTSASKAFNVAGLKCAVLVAGSEGMRSHLQRLPESSWESAGIVGVAASIAAWRHGDAWLDAVLAQLDRTRHHLGELLESRLPGIGYRPPQASYLAWLDCRALGLGDDPRERFLQRGRVALGRGLDFGPPGAGFVRLTMATSHAILAELVARMASALDAG